jgi:hypothetical protein
VRWRQDEAKRIRAPSADMTGDDFGASLRTTGEDSPGRNNFLQQTKIHSEYHIM